MYEHLKKLADEWNALGSDEDRFRYLLEHRGILKLHLDNDMTFVTYADSVLANFSDDQVDDLPELNDFYNYLGWNDGIFTLLRVIGLPAESV